MSFRSEKRGLGILKSAIFLKVAILFLLISILSFNVLSTEYYTTSAAPVISILFDEQINLDSITAQVLCLEKQGICFDIYQSGNVTQTPQIDVALENNNLTVLYSLGLIPNDNYTFHTTVEDVVGNSQSYDLSFTVDAPLMDISVVLPNNAWSNEIPFDVAISPEYNNSNCWYFPGNIQRPLTPDEGYTFNFTNIVDGARWFYIYDITNNTVTDTYQVGQSLPFYVACNAGDENYGWADLTVYWDTTAPIYSLEFDPSPLTDLVNRIVDVTVTSSPYGNGESADEIGCEIAILIDNGANITSPVFIPFDSVGGDISKIGNYSQINTHELNFENIPITDFTSHSYQYKIRCRNKAGTLGDNITEDLTVQLSPDFSITQISPDNYVNSATIPVEVLTSVETIWCNISKDGFNELMLINTSTNKNHYYYLSSVSEGSHSYDIDCKSTFGSNDHSSISFTVDRVSPDNVSINTNDYSCSLAELSFKLHADDDLSGVSYFNYTITGPESELIASDLTSDTTIEYDYTLIENESYIIKVVAVDRAGNPSSSVTKTIVATGPDLVECDTVSPTINFIDEKEPGVTVVNITCSDSQSGCRDSFDYSLLNNLSADCTYLTAGSWSTTTQFSIWEDTKFCIRAKDYNDNEREDDEIITVTFNVSTHCSNGLIDFDESDIDCGGTECFACDAGSACSSDDDCSTNWCNNGVCDTPACDDTILNGLETDVDCGGNCDGCEINKTCVLNDDCLSFWCNESVCAASSCEDYVVNGLETDVDCGGLECMPCDNGQNCFEDFDCVSNYCNYGICEEMIPINPIDDEKLNIISLILLILGILFILVGVGYILYEHYYLKPKETTISTETHFARPVKHKLSPEEIKRLHKKRLMMKEKFKKRSSSMKDKFSTKLSTFDEETKEIKSDKDKEESEKAKKVMEKISKLSDKEVTPKDKEYEKLDKGLEEDYVALGDLKKNVVDKLKDDPKFNDKVAEDVFAALDKMQLGVDKKTKIKDDYKERENSDKNYVTEEDFKKLDEVIKKSKEEKGKSGKIIESNKKEQLVSVQDKEDVFSALDDLASGSKAKNKSEKVDFSARKLFNSDDLVNLFKKKELSADVFKVILSELLNSGKLTKADVSGIVFRLLEQDLLEKDIAHKILKDLKLIKE